MSEPGVPTRVMRFLSVMRVEDVCLGSKRARRLIFGAVELERNTIWEFVAFELEVVLSRLMDWPSEFSSSFSCRTGAEATLIVTNERVIERMRMPENRL